MKYFTREWCFGSLDDEEKEQAWTEYKQYLESIYWKLPFTLKILANNISLHDGIIKRANFLTKENILEINGIFRDL